MVACLTFRSWLLGIFFTVVISAANVFFSLRYPAPLVTPIIVQIMSFPLGKLLAWCLPTTEWDTPKFLQRLGFDSTLSVNPGPFTIKEHTVIVIMANCATAPAVGITFTLVTEKFYGFHHGILFDFCLLLSSQLIGFSFAGMARRLLVDPASLIWPQNLVFCTLLNVLHAEEDDGKTGGISRWRFLLYVGAGAFFWCFLPGTVIAFLSQIISFIDKIISIQQDFSFKLSQFSPLSVGFPLVSVHHT